ncbi:FecCD family ABC transporter permease [Corynebacterium sp. 335C]
MTAVNHATGAAPATGADGLAVRDRLRRAARRRTAIAVAVLAAIAAAGYIALLALGPLMLSPGEVVDVLTGGGDRRAITVVWDLRLPAAVATVVVGAALGLAGSWTQTMSRNPLASPDVLGVTGGASVLVVAGTVVATPAFAADIPGYWWRAGLAVAGAALIVVLLLLLGGFGSSRRVILVGIALSMMCQALVGFLLVRAKITRAAEAMTWLAGSTGFVRTEALLPMILGLVPFALLGLVAGRHLPLLAHDDDSASALGVRVRGTRTLLLVAATGVVAVVVAVVGPIGFVALLAPQVARLTTGSPTPTPGASAAAGAALLAGCGALAAAVPFSAPVGLVTAMLGGPVLIWLVWRTDIANGRN